MKVAICGPLATEAVAQHLDTASPTLPRGYEGAPVLGTLVDVLLRRGHDVIAVTTSTELSITSEPVWVKGRRFSVCYVPARRRAFRPEDGVLGRAADVFRLERRGLRRAVAMDPPDVVHAHWSYEFAMAALETGLPHVITCHDAPQTILSYSRDAYRLVRYFMARSVLARARRITAVSPYLRDKLIGYASAPIQVVPNPVPVGPMSRNAVSPRLIAGAPRIGMVINGWVTHKNPRVAMRAFALCRQHFPQAELHLIGRDFGQGGPAESWARKQGLSNGMRFVGPLSHESLHAALLEVDLLLHPSLEETFGMAIAEAMALGIPVVGGMRSGAVPWVIGKGGIICDVTDAEAIRTAMFRILTDRPCYQEAAERAASEVRDRFSPDRVAALYEAEYECALAGQAGRSGHDVGSRQFG